MSFRQYGGLTYAAKNNIVRNNYTNANNLSVMNLIGQPDSLIITDSGLQLNADLYIKGTTLNSSTGVTISNGIYFPDGTFQNTAATVPSTNYWEATTDNVNNITNTNSGNVQIGNLVVSTSATAPTPPAGTNNTQIATTAFVNSANLWQTTSGNVNNIINVNSGNVQIGNLVVSTSATAPTPPAGTNNTQIATTAFVNSAIGTSVSGVVTTTYTSNQTITLGTSIKKAEFVLVGGGGAGQSAVSSAYGGGGGAVCLASYINVGVNTSVTLQVGAGGSGSAGADGLPGRPTSVTIGAFIVTADGGAGGTIGGGLGGTGTGLYSAAFTGLTSTSINGVGNNVVQSYGKGGNGVNNIGLSGSPGTSGVIIVTTFS